MNRSATILLQVLALCLTALPAPSLHRGAAGDVHVSALSLRAGSAASVSVCSCGHDACCRLNGAPEEEHRARLTGDANPEHQALWQACAPGREHQTVPPPPRPFSASAIESESPPRLGLSREARAPPLRTRLATLCTYLV